MDLGLQGKVAIVTGSSEGIGYAVALELAREGARVVICGRREALLNEARDAVAEQTGAEVLAVQTDVQKLDDVKRLVRSTVERFGAIHILVNNAGSVPRIDFTDVDDEQWHQHLEGKLVNYIRVAREVIPEMQKLGWGRIINVAGRRRRRPVPLRDGGRAEQRRGDQLDQVDVAPVRRRRHPGERPRTGLDRHAASGARPPP